MNRLSYLLIGLLFVILVSCGDDDSNNQTSIYKVEMTITGDQSLEFLAKTATIVLPPVNPNFLVTAFYTENGKNHTFSMTIEDEWLDKKEIDLARGYNSGIFAYDGGKDGNTYRVIEGTFSVETLTEKTVRGKLNFTAQKIGTTDITIKVENGKINVTK